VAVDEIDVETEDMGVGLAEYWMAPRRVAQLKAHG
jgi:hypothetical protein